jgi:NAD(P)-dependent dehydrogenase (short-subunit alcohol dehydrogenase family)
MAKTQPRNLNGKVVAITGGARGIGKATAQALVRAGARVGIGDIDADLARQTAAGLGPDVRAYELDVTSRPSFAAFLDGVESDLGPLDVLVNNAGIMPVGPFLEEDDAAAVRQIDINVHGVMFGMKEALPRMLKRDSGHVVNLASVAGKAGFPYLTTYCATKHAVVGLSESLRGELRDTGIEFTCVMPSLVNTELTSGVQAGRGVKKAEPEDVADAIVDALREPKFDVYVPKAVGRISAVMNALPRAAREAIGRALDADKVMTQADMSGRAAYEQRVANSEPTPLETAEPAPNARPEAAREPVA